MDPIIEAGSTVLFQGDSITDAGRGSQGPGGMGGGYAMRAATMFSTLFPDRSVTFVNRGISGNRVRDLEGRWQRDCLDLRPSWISIMIGINDTWRAFDHNDPTSTEDYELAYRRILQQAKDVLQARFILIEPFVLPFPEDRKKWRVDLDPRIHVVRSLAREFKAILVPMDGIFAAAAAGREPAYWAGDGVHPTAPGHALIARSWLRAVGAI